LGEHCGDLSQHSGIQTSGIHTLGLHGLGGVLHLSPSFTVANTNPHTTYNGLLVIDRIDITVVPRGFVELHPKRNAPE